MKRVTVVSSCALILLVALTAGVLMGRDPEPAARSAAAEPSPGSVIPEESPSPSPSESAPATPRQQPAVHPDDRWDGPQGTMTVTGSDAVALTFDDGPSPTWTPKVLNTLRDWQVKATFCVVGTEVRANPELVKAIVADGHSLCNHSWHHEMDLGDRSVDTIRENLERTNAAIHDIVPDARIGYYRQPGGKWTERVVKVAMDMGMIPLHWSVDPSDWNMSTPSNHIQNQVVKHTSPGSVVLMHDGGGDRRRTSQALDPILADLTSRFTLIPL